jgi:endonuclease-3
MRKVAKSTTVSIKRKTKANAAEPKGATASVKIKPKAKATEPKEKSSKSSLVSSEVAQEEMRLLCLKYPDADCELTYGNDFQLLTSVILSAQTTDVQVNKVTPKLFKKFPDAKSLANANLDEVKEIVKPTGYYNNKAKAIQACAAALVKNFGGKVPDNLEQLTTLPGVGRKTANVVLGVIHKVPGWTVDTHVQRLSQRMGFTNNTDPYKIEMDLQELFPEQNWTKYSITIIWHGRRQCYARNPDCPSCPIKHLCPSSLAP